VIGVSPVDSSAKIRMMARNDLPDFHINPLAADPFLKKSSLISLAFLVLALFSNGTLNLIFWTLTIFFGFLAFVNLRGRLSKPWRRIHYPVMATYPGALMLARRFSGKTAESKVEDKDIDDALLIILKMTFPTLSETKLRPHLNGVFVEQKALTNSIYLSQVILAGQPQLIQLIDKDPHDQTLLDQSFDAKVFFENRDPIFRRYLKIRLVIADLVGRKYGEQERFRYLYAVITNEAR